MTSPAVRVDNAIEKAGRAYGITKDVSVTVTGNRADNIADVFKDFGFSIVENKPDYLVRVEVQNLGFGRSWRYQIYPAKLRLKITDKKTGKEYYYKANGEFRFFVSAYGGANRTYHYPSDPYGVAAKIAATRAIGDFMGEHKIPHRRPEKKKKNKSKGKEGRVPTVPFLILKNLIR